MPRTKTYKMSLEQAVLHIISKHQVADQATLLSMLAEAGITLTQGTLSRHLSQWSIQKRDGYYQQVIPRDHPLPPYSLHESPPNLILLQTGPRLGMALAIRIDRGKVPGVAGTLAGDDTLMVALAPGSSIPEIRERIEEILGPPTL
jgi:transcriptional regulator of arginine metabolism